MAPGPTSIEIRSYQVGFGDCFLLSFLYPTGRKRHVLIDFGSSELPKGLKPSTHMPRIAEDIRTVCKGRLDAVVATHRHRDHISGFATDGTSGRAGTVISACRPKVVLQPWTEDPLAATDATHATKRSSRSKKGFLSGLASMHRIAEAVSAMTLSPPPSMSAEVVRRLRFIGETNVKNKSAVANLIKMGKDAEAVWASYGDASGLERVLPGVKVQVLGPPDLTQTAAIRTMRSSDPEEFWSLLAGPGGSRGGGAVPLSGGTEKRSRSDVPPEARWFRDRLEKMSGEQLLEIVTSLDEQMNNTSLILLFAVGRKKLLFPGDAQLENWAYALKDAPKGKAEANRQLLAGADVYKVGHHGSRNATPKQLLWEGFRKRDKGRGPKLVALLSTLPNKHPGVPRPTLLDALARETELRNTNELRLEEDLELCDVKTITV